MSPGWMRPPISSHTEMVMLPVLSATLQDLTSCPSFVLVTRPAGRTAAQGGSGRDTAPSPPPPDPQRGTRVGGPEVGRAGRHLPISSTIKTTFKFFNPGFMSFMRWYVSLAALMLRPARGIGPAGRAEPASRGGEAAAGTQGRARGHRQPSQGIGTQAPRGCALTVRPPPLPRPTTPPTQQTPSLPLPPALRSTCALRSLLYQPGGPTSATGRGGEDGAEWNCPGYVERRDWAAGGREPRPRADWASAAAILSFSVRGRRRHGHGYGYG